MRELLTADDLISHIMLLRAVDSRVILLVEGDSDAAVLDPFLNSESCQSVPGHGKQAVLRAVEIADETGIPRILGLVDLDWADLLEERTKSKNVVYTDYYDLDAHLVMSDTTCRRVVLNFCESAEVSKYLQKAGCKTVTELAVRLAHPVGVLRMVSMRDGLQLSLARFPMGDTINRGNGTVSVARVVSVAMARSRAAARSRDEVARILRDELPSAMPKRRYCSGHDLISVLAHLISKKWGGRVGSDTLHRVFRVGASWDDLKSSGIFAAVVEWQERTGARVWRFE